MCPSSNDVFPSLKPDPELDRKATLAAEALARFYGVSGLDIEPMKKIIIREFLR